jgi:hypothetical protein
MTSQLQVIEARIKKTKLNGDRLGPIAIPDY